MTAITPPITYRVCLDVRGTRLYTGPLALEKELRQVRDGLAAIHGAANVWIVEETVSHKRIMDPDPPGALVGTENGKQSRRLSTDWPTLEKVLIAKRGPLKGWAHKQVPLTEWRQHTSSEPLFAAVADELGLPGVVEQLTWLQGSRTVEITYHIS